MLSKSTKLTNSDDFHSSDCSTIILIVAVQTGNDLLKNFLLFRSKFSRLFFFISFIVSISIGKSSSAGIMSAVCSRVGMFRNSWNCSFHNIFCSSEIVRTVQSVSFTVFQAASCYQIISFLHCILYSSFMFLCSAAVFPSITNSAI